MAVSAAVSGDLSDVVDGVGIDKNPSGVCGDQRVQIFHAGVRSPDHGVGSVGGDVAIAHDDVGVIDSESNAVGAPLDQAEVADLTGRIPQNGVPVTGGLAAIGLAGDVSGGIDGAGDAGDSSPERAQVFHGGTVPEEAVRLEGRAVREDGFPDDQSVIVDRESGGEDRVGERPKILDFAIAPESGVDDAVLEKRISSNYAGRVDLEGCTGRASGEHTEIGDGASRRPFHGDKIGSGLTLHVGVANHGARIADTDGATHGCTRERAEIFHSMAASPVEGTLAGDQAGARIALGRLDVGTADNVAEVVDPEAAAFVSALENTQIGNGVRLSGCESRGDQQKCCPQRDDSDVHGRVPTKVPQSKVPLVCHQDAGMRNTL